MNTQIGFSGDSKLLMEIETFFISHGINAQVEHIVRASEPTSKKQIYELESRRNRDKPKPETEDKQRATGDWLTVFAKTADAAKAFFEFLGGKTGEARLRIGTGESAVEITKHDSPEKLEKYLAKNEGFHFDLSIKL